MKMATKVVKRYFTVWWIPLLAYLIPIAIFIIATFIKDDNIVDASLIVFFVNIIGNFIAAIVQVVLKKWYFIFPQIIVSASLSYYVSMLFIYSPPDYYGANKSVPNNISVNIPVEKEIVEGDLSKDDFVLAAGPQPGIYHYYTTYHPKEKGVLYIKAYEATSNDRLSETRITERSKIIIEGTHEKFHSGEFKIYEGSWGDKYAARIELWFRPENRVSEYEIAEKTYLIEGWMR